MTISEEDLPFKCLDCSVFTNFIGEYYMVNTDLWLQANPDYEGMLCITCLEKRLGRTLKAKDFIYCLVNEINGMFPKSELLINRLTTK